MTASEVLFDVLFDGGTWLEGPAWTADGLLFSDVVESRTYLFADGLVSVLREGTEWTNGRTVSPAGEVIECSHGLRAVLRDGVVVADRWAGGRFNSPNDVVVAADGAIWFTDPPYGLHESGREGRPGPQDYDGCFVFRIDPDGTVEPVIEDVRHPNGLAFSPDGRTLYVADSAYVWFREHPLVIRAYAIEDGRAVDGRDFVTPGGVPDGMRVASDGTLWTSAGRGVERYSPAGSLVERIDLPHAVSNLCFGPDGDVYVTATSTLLRLRR